MSRMGAATSIGGLVDSMLALKSRLLAGLCNRERKRMET